MRLMEDIFSWKINFLSLENLYFRTQNINKIVVNRINQGMSWAGWNPSSEIIMNTETHQRR
tara:strand:- start:129 stop:311 length:183 start_codon:yes stop_codon:yes gene_type:complete